MALENLTKKFEGVICRATSWHKQYRLTKVFPVLCFYSHKNGLLRLTKNRKHLPIEGTPFFTYNTTKPN
jgi:hypothetical protein